MRRAGRLPALLLAALLPLAATSLGAGAPDAAAVTRVGPGETHTGDLVSLGRPVVVEGTVAGTVVAVSAPVTVSGSVRGDVVVFFDDVVLGGGGRVDADVLVVGGELRPPAGDGGSVGGRRLTLAALQAAFLAELQTSPVDGAAVSPLLLAFRLFLLAAWLAVSLLLLRVRPRLVAGAAAHLRGNMLAVTALGLAAVLSGLLLSAGLLLAVPSPAALVLAGALLAGLFAGKVFGLTALFLVLGRALTARSRRGSPLFGDPAALSVGLLVLGLVSLVPAAGALIWGAASLTAIGLAFRSAFGRPAEPLAAI